MNAKTEAAVRNHGKTLLEMFPGAKERDPVNLCRKLRLLERKGNALGLRLCNGPEFPGGGDEADALAQDVLTRVNVLLGNTNCLRRGYVPIRLNRDPRGYALKIESKWMESHRDGAAGRLHRDLGGYGILAPDLTADRR